MPERGRGRPDRGGLRAQPVFRSQEALTVVRGGEPCFLTPGAAYYLDILGELQNLLEVCALFQKCFNCLSHVCPSITFKC